MINGSICYKRLGEEKVIPKTQSLTQNQMFDIKPKYCEIRGRLVKKIME